MSNLALPSNIHPVFQSCSFIDDFELKDHIYKVMQNNTMDAALSGGLEGRAITNKYSNCLCQLIDCIVRFFQKVWHNMCMACCSGYRDQFNHAAEKITLASNIIPLTDVPIVESDIQTSTNVPSNETDTTPSNNEIERIDIVAQNTFVSDSPNVVENPSQTEETLAISRQETSTPTNTNSTNLKNIPVNQSEIILQTIKGLERAAIISNETIKSLEQTARILPVQNYQFIIPALQLDVDTTALFKKTWFEIETFFKDKGLNLIGEMFALLLKKDPSVIKFWNVNEEAQTFSIGFTKTFRLYVPTEFNPGGGVFILGDNRNKLITGKWVKDFSEFKLKAEKLSNNFLKCIRDEFNAHLPRETQNVNIKGVTFTQGFEVYSKGSMPGKSSVDYFMEMTSEQIMIGYSWLLNVYGQARAIEEYRTQWANSEVIEEKNGMSKRIDQAKSQKMDALD